MRTIPRLWPVILFAVLLSSCSLGTQINKTKLNFQFPFEPSFAGYVVDISSKTYTANLICSFSQDGSSGQVLDLDAKSDAKPVGVCDRKSMTLDVGIKEKITVTVILGGFPFISEVSRTPSRFVDITGEQACLGCKQAEYDFAFAGWPR